jgi:hypothetical protein
MDRVVATELLQHELALARQRGYQQLAAEVGEDIQKQVIGPDGKEYQLSLLVIWDQEVNGAVRLIASIDDGGWRAFVPLTAGDLVYPDTPSSS